MRQKDGNFAQILIQIRVGKSEENLYVDKMMKARELAVGEDLPTY